MILIVGLGNPGEKYKDTRHNAGFTALEKFLKKKTAFFYDWKENKKFQALISDSKDKKIKLILPQTFMNNSGMAVAVAAKFYKISPADIWVVHDDLDLALGKIKVQINRSAAGHNGIKSIIEKLGSQNFVRFRIGIKPLATIKEPSEKLVLKKFNSDETKLFEKGLEKTIAALETCLKQGLEKTMTEFNQ